MRNHRHTTLQEPDYKALAENLATQLHILKLHYHYIFTRIRTQDEEQKKQPDIIADHRFWPSLWHRLFHKARQQ